MKFHSRVVDARGEFSDGSIHALELALTDRQVVILSHVAFLLSVSRSARNQRGRADRGDVGRGGRVDREDWVRRVGAVGVKGPWGT